MNTTDLMVYDVPNLDGDLEVDFLEDDTLEAMEAGIKKIQVTSDLLALVQGVAIVRVEREGLWRQGGYANLRTYRIEQGARLGMPRSTISLRRKIAEGWLDNKKLLGKTDLTGHVAKLPYLGEALGKHDKKEVLKHFIADSYRDFLIFAKPRKEHAEGLPDVDLAIRSGRVLLDGHEVMRLAESLDPKETDFVEDVLRSAYRARRGACIAHVVACYDDGEARAVDNFLKKLRATK